MKEELCEDLVGEWISRSAAPGEAGAVRLRYDEIIREFRCLRRAIPGKISASETRKLETAVRNAPDDGAADLAVELYVAALRGGIEPLAASLHSQLSRHLQSDLSLKKFQKELDQAIRGYVYGRWQNQLPESRLYNVELSSALWLLLSEEWLRDPAALFGLLSGVFKKWRKIDDPKSRWRYRIVMAQMAPKLGADRQKLQEHLESIGVLSSSKGKSARGIQAELQRIGKCVSRQFGNTLLGGSRRLDPPRKTKSAVT